ncbi:hypothetical protein GE061_004591 [Apolygus lucorum]|uniref:Uncharacterized protein n=1 Tax=Apolygus lucorum TaxID=248454 RepID=A0A8S9WZT3_APOLU|nr:hypothetical protein GE061_004591 [Apolygus lucorum]
MICSSETYSILCVVSLYQEYKAGRGTADFEYVNRRVPGVRYAPQPTGTSFLSTRRAVTYHETRASPTGSPPQDVRSGSRKHVQFGDDRMWLAPPPPSVIHIESPKGGRKLRPNRTYSNSTRSSNVSVESAASGEIFPAKGENPAPISPVSLESTIQETQSGEWTSHGDSSCDPTCDAYNYHVDTDLTHAVTLVTNLDAVM